jgi:hypothetical protein
MAKVEQGLLDHLSKTIPYHPRWNDLLSGFWGFMSSLMGQRPVNPA